MAPMLNPHFNNTLFLGSVSPLWEKTAESFLATCEYTHAIYKTHLHAHTHTHKNAHKRKHPHPHPHPNTCHTKYQVLTVIASCRHKPKTKVEVERMLAGGLAER